MVGHWFHERVGTNDRRIGGSGGRAFNGPSVENDYSAKTFASVPAFCLVSINNNFDWSELCMIFAELDIYSLCILARRVSNFPCIHSSKTYTDFRSWGEKEGCCPPSSPLSDLSALYDFNILAGEIIWIEMII